MTRAIAAVTIGQTPRPDLVSEIRTVLGATIEVVEFGALDGLTQSEVVRSNPEPHVSPLVTRLRDGCAVVVDEPFVAERIQTLLDAVPDRVELVALLCTGEFPALRCRKPVLWPERVLAGVVAAVAPARLGVLVPLDAQRAILAERWSRRVARVTVEVGSPYGDAQAVAGAARRLAEREVDLVVLDCIGYTAELKALVRSVVRCPVIQASTALAHVAAELVG